MIVKTFKGRQASNDCYDFKGDRQIIVKTLKGRQASNDC